jgi:predicted lipoprotein with Yx(FWY)xxD motif
MKRLLAPAIIAAAVLAAGGIALAVRDSEETGSPSSSALGAPSTDSMLGATPATVNATEIEGVGTVLTDAEGRVLYASDDETADPDVLCTDACAEFWAPLESTDGAPTGSSDVSDLGVVERPDGSRQVTFDGRRLYTFTEDEPGEASGDGLSDTFGGQRFTWHAVSVEETGSLAASVPDTDPNAGDVFEYPGY